MSDESRKSAIFSSNLSFFFLWNLVNSVPHM
jgi:hypothetical protein